MPNKRKDLNIAGPNLWYLIGLIATDGCLSSDGRHIDITSKDREFLERIKGVTGIGNRIGSKYGIRKQRAFRIQLANKKFYNFLLFIGLTPHKSLTVGSLNVSHKYFVDFLRGIIDGDGCIRRWTHPSNHREQWSLRIYSGSGIFIKWLKSVIGSVFHAEGKIYKETDRLWILKYGKMAAKEILRKCYYDKALALERKSNLAHLCINSDSGWKRSKTVFA